MIQDLTEALAKDISDRTGIGATAASSMGELLENVETNFDNLPMVQLLPIMIPFLEPIAYEAHYADGTTKQMPYDIDHIPVEISVLTFALGKTEEDTESLASTIRTSYTDTSDAGILTIPVDSGGTFVTGKYSVKQLRSAPAEYGAFFGTLINPTAGIKVPIPYPENDLHASLSDREAISNLLIAYYYYMHILESGVPERISNKYSKLFEEKGGFAKSKLAGGKKALFKKLRENEAVASALDSNIAQTFTGETISNLADDFRAGHMDKGEFDAYFSNVIAVIPDLYDRAMRREAVETTLAEATARVAELQKRASTIADSLGIEESSGENSYYKPRSSEAAAIYIQTLGTDQDATLQDAFAAYRALADEKAANAQAMQDEMSNQIADKIASKGGGGFLASTIADGLRK